MLSDTLLPQKNVYLYAGAWKGAGYLMDNARLRSVMPVAEWHEFFPDMESWKIEDMLCLYKDVFKKLKENECVTKSDISPSSGSCSSPAPKKCLTDATLFKGKYTKEYVLRRLQEAEKNVTKTIIKIHNNKKNIYSLKTLFGVFATLYGLNVPLGV